MTDERLMGDNLLQPLEFDGMGIDEFTNENACMCGMNLVTAHLGDNKFKAVCPNCGDIYQHNHVTKWQAEQAKSNTIGGKLEIHWEQLQQNGCDRTEAEILAELGF